MARYREFFLTSVHGVFPAAVLLCFVAGTLPVLALSEGLKALDEKNGFRDLTFGAAIEGIEGMKLIEDGGANKYYSRSEDELSLGGAELTGITYGFYKGKLASVILEAKGICAPRHCRARVIL